MKRMESARKKSNGNVTWTKPAKPGGGSRARFAICVDNSEYPASLELHKIYRVLPDANAARDGDLRVIDESGEDYLFPASYFVLINLPRQVVRAMSKPSGRAV